MAYQFSYLAGCAPLTDIVEENFEVQIGKPYKPRYYHAKFHTQGHLEVFLREQTQTVDFVEYMEKIERACNLENSGSQTFKYLHILVKSGIFFIIYSCIMIQFRDQLVNILIRGREVNLSGWKKMVIPQIAALTSMQRKLTGAIHLLIALSSNPRN